MSSRYAVSEIFAAFSYPICGFSAVTSINDYAEMVIVTFFIRLDPNGAARRMSAMHRPHQLIDVSKLCRMTGL